MADYGIICLIPTLVVLVLAVISRRTIEPLIAGSLVGLLILAPSDLLTNFTGVMLSVMGDETIGWIIMVCGLMGSLIALLAGIGGAAAFGRLVASRVKTRVGALITAWLLGLAIFIDDYLNALTISSSMKKVTDKFGVSREMLAYVVDSTAAPICVLVPLSTWAVYFAALLEENTGASTGEGLLIYMEAIPYMFYAWAAVVIVPLVILRKIPHLGAMAKAENENARKYQMRPVEEQSSLADDADNGNQGRAGLNFFVPILSLIFFTWYLGVDILNGVIVALSITIVSILLQRLLPPAQIFDTMLEGFKSMLLPLGTVVAGFMLKEVNDQLGLASYVIGTVEPVMTPLLLPLVTFITMALIAFATGSFWGIFAVAMPIVIPLAASVEADMALVIGALISASAFGSHTCFYGDSTVLSAHGSGCGVIEHALTQLPYAALAAAVASIAFLIAAI